MKVAAAEHHADLYPERHLNVFVPYQSHDLDYNVTRALISTLRWSRPELTKAFLAEVAGVTADDGAFHFDLQSCDYEDFDPADAKTQVLVGISRGGRLATRLPNLDDGVLAGNLLAVLRAPVGYEAKVAEVRRLLARPELDDDDVAVLYHSLEELEDGCMPDGWIFSPQAGVCVLLECKLTELLDLTQMQRYGDVYFSRSFEADDVVLKTWEDVATFFAGHKDDDDARTAFLCGQLCDYLDLLGLAPWNGFKPYDFDPDAAQESLPKFRRFGQRLHDQATEQGLPLGEMRPSPTGIRLGFSDPNLPGELRIDLLEAGLRMELRCGDATEGNTPGRASLDDLLARTEDGEQNPLAGQDLPNLTARIERLRSATPDGEAFVELETYSADLACDEFGFVLSEVRRQHPTPDAARGVAGHYRRAALSLGRLVARDDALGDAAGVLEQAMGTVSTLVQAAKALAPQAAVAE